MRHDRTLVHAVSELAQPVRQAAHCRMEIIHVGTADVHEPFDPVCTQFLRRHGPDAPQGIHRQLLEKWLDLLGADDRETIGLFPSGRDLCQKLVGGDAGGCGQLRLGADALLEPPGHRRPERFAPRVLGHVEIRFVERHRFDQGRDLAEDREHCRRCRLVTGEVGTDDRQRGAQPDGLRHRHRRVNTEHARLVAGGGHDTALVGAATDDDGSAAKRRIVALLDRRVEGIHVDVKNPSDHENAEFRMQKAQ